MHIQRENADANVAIEVSKLLKEYSVCSPIVANPIKTASKKWIDKNDIAQALLIILDRYSTL